MTDELNWKKRKEKRQKRRDSENYPSGFDQQQQGLEGNNWTAIAPWTQLMYVGVTGFNVLFAIAVSLWFIILTRWIYILLLLVALGVGVGMFYVYTRQKNFIRISYFIQLILGFLAILTILILWPSWLVITATLINALTVIVDYFYMQKLDRSRLRRKS